MSTGPSPGIVEIGQGDNGLAFFSYELGSVEAFARLSDLPLAEIKGDRKSARTNKLGCSPAADRLTCLLDIVADGHNEIWFFREASETHSRTLIRLPEEAVDEFFWTGLRSSIAGRAPLAIAAFPSETAPAKVWLENKEIPSTFYDYDLLHERQVVVVRPSFDGDALAGLFLILNLTSELVATPSEAVEVLAASKAGEFTRYAVPPHCEVLGAINDTLICGENTRGRNFVSDLPQYPYVMRLSLPNGFEEDVFRATGAPAFQKSGQGIVFRGVSAGVIRPFHQMPGQSVATPALASSDRCVDPMQHVNVWEISAKGTAALLVISGPLTPKQYVLAPIVDGRIHICDSSAQTILQEIAEPIDVSDYTVERLFVGNSVKVPVTVISGPKDGPLNEHLAIGTYAAFGLTLPENYLGPWLTNWIAEGGRYAFAHLPGGGGFGAKWTQDGFGIEQKIKVAALLNEVTSDLVSKGYAADGKITVVTESGGGPAAAIAIAGDPLRYASFAVRAGCLALVEGLQPAPCTRSHEFGDWSNPKDRQRMIEFDPLTQILRNKNFPPIILGTPELDDRLDLLYQERMARALEVKSIRRVFFEGMNHTERKNPEAEKRWVRAIAQAALNSQKVKD